jgi:hypothetical protein
MPAASLKYGDKFRALRDAATSPMQVIISELGWIGGVKVERVNGYLVRLLVEPDFNNWAQSLQFPKTMPQSPPRIWLDVEQSELNAGRSGNSNAYSSRNGETEFFITNAYRQYLAMKRGMPYPKAVEIGDRFELRMRERYSSALGLPNAEGRDPSQVSKYEPDVWPSLVVSDLGTSPMGVNTYGVPVQIVDGEKIRDRYRVEFTAGGHDLVYKWVRPRTIILDDDDTPEDQKDDLYHEAQERHYMESMGIAYPRAHMMALADEGEMRLQQAQGEPE